MLIGLTGYKGSGKSTVAKYLEEEYGFKRLNFKDALVEEMKERLPDVLNELAYVAGMMNQYETGIGESWTVNDLFELKPPLMRTLMQNYGTEVRRKDDENYWVKKYIAKILATGGNIVTDDVRFLNEIQAVVDAGGIMIRVTRPDVTHGGTHQSETEQESFVVDFTVDGVPGEPDSLRKQVDSIIQDLKAD